MKLEVGMYVRGKYYQYRGKIGKIIKNYNNDLEISYKDGILKTNVGSFIDDNYDINGKQYKASFDIIDILEVGDYVNGHRVEEINFEDEEIFTDSEYYCGIVKFCNIKSVITHEQMEQMAYKVSE
jgi:hypothetical protein|nr:MAG TPA: hypothetical protein [Caudoviricetes sp.]